MASPLEQVVFRSSRQAALLIPHPPTVNTLPHRGSPLQPPVVWVYSCRQIDVAQHVNTTLLSYFYGGKIPRREMWLSSFILTLYIDQLLQGEKATLTVKASILDLTISSLTWQ